MVRRALHFTLRKLWLLLAILLVLAAVALSVVRYSLPYIDNYRADIEAMVAERFGQQVRMGALSADWSTFGPSLVLQDVELTVGDHYPFDIHVERTHLVLNLWQSLWQREWMLEDFVLEGVRFDYAFDGQIANQQDTGVVRALEQLLLFQLESFQVVNSEIYVSDPQGVGRRLYIEQLSWRNQSPQRQGIGRFRVSDIAQNSFNFIINANGNSFLNLHGELYVEAEDLDFSPWFEAAIEGVDITEARVNVNAWFDFADAKVGQAQVHFGENSLRWQRDGNTHELVTSPVTWGFWPQSDGFLMASEALTIAVDDAVWPVEAASWRYQNQRHTWNLSNLSFRDTAPLWSLFGSPGAQIRDWFSGIQPAGVINQVQVQLDENMDWSFYSRADTLDWQAHRGVPGLSGLSFELWSTEYSGAFALRGEQVDLVSPDTYDQPQQLSQIDWQGYWHRLEDGFRVALPYAQVHIGDVLLEQQFSLTREHDDSPVVEWWLQGEGANMAVHDAMAMLPLQLGSQLTHYLQDAIVDGEVRKMNLLWRGSLEQFPYYQHDGVFMASLNATPLAFKFQPDWPAIEDTELALVYREHSLLIHARGGRLLDTELVQVDASIPDLVFGQPWLLLDAKARGSAAAAREVFSQSPLADSVGATLMQLDSDDTFDGEFSLRVPLFAASEDGSDPAEIGVEGKVIFAGQDLNIVPIDLELNNLSGELQFNGARLDASAIRADVFELPVHVSLQGYSNAPNARIQARDASVEEAYQLDIQMDSRWRQSQMHTSPILGWLAPFVDGHVESDTTLSLQIAGSRLDYEWRMRNHLYALDIHLPAPMNQPAQDDRFIDIVARGDEQDIFIQMLWPDLGRFESQLELGQSQFSRALIELGPNLSRGPGMPVAGMDIYADVDELGLSQWLGALSMIQNGDGNGLPWTLPAVENLQLTIGQTQVLNQNFDHVRVTGRQQQGDWDIQVDASQGRGRIAVPRQVLLGDDVGEHRIDIEIDYLNLRSETGQHDDAANDDTDTEQHQALANRPNVAFFERLPPMHVVCELCRYQDTDLGRIQLQFDPREPGTQIGLINVRRSGAELNLTGGWYGQGEAVESYINGWVAVADVGNLIADFGSSSVVRDSSAQVELSLRWPGSPAEFSLADLNGQVDWRLGAGYLRDVSDGGARLFSLFSLESLMRKLTLDFRDIFARGMFYSSFRGTLDIEEGVVYTQNTRMNGSAGDMEVTGSTDLVTEALDYELVYIPKVTSSLPVLVAWMVNPPTGIAALLIDRVLHDAQVISRLEYSITGTISEPIVNEEARAQREVELPEVELEQLQLLEEQHGTD
ncbi:YhdP family protein [Aliidiomarina maris]|uniref:TIGR02099 family protein n=1 Tax=Aliidiomarina maris TaxID=531312 RepID=A0A327X2Y1_9GAMM|nr:YhdP family protein [Aliidiomarina maris]RAJ99243.1 uncharacterized protein (TIGR02099 family) [Aliidiomarina maris]RUO27612.1 TIGR02099 family protein [Aliidiomarina maris]